MRRDAGVRLLFAGAGAALLLGCSFPEDRGLSRPEAVRATSFSQRDLSIDGVRVRYVDEGPRDGEAEAVPALILPGHTARIEDYDALVLQLSKRRRVLLPDLPGKGYSEKPLRRYDFAYYQACTIAFLDRLGVRDVDLVGGSLGANLSLRLAARAPDRVRRVVAWAPGSLGEPRPWLARAIRIAGRSPVAVRLALRIHSRFWFRSDFPGREAALREKFLHYDEVMSPGFAAMYAGMAADSVGTSLLPLAPTIGQPTLLLVGARDEGGGVQDGIRRLEARLPRAELVVLPGAGHSLVSEALPALLSAIESFLDAPTETGNGSRS